MSGSGRKRTTIETAIPNERVAPVDLVSFEELLLSEHSKPTGIDKAITALTMHASILTAARSECIYANLAKTVYPTQPAQPSILTHSRPRQQGVRHAIDSAQSGRNRSAFWL